MKTVEELRKIAIEANSKQWDSFAHKVYLEHAKYLEREMLKAAKRGEFYCWSAKLTDTFNHGDVEDSDRLREYLKNKIKTVFGDAYNYKVRYITSEDVMEISWGKEN